MEQSSVFQLISLLARTIEAISFTLLLNDHKLGDLIKQYVLQLFDRNELDKLADAKLTSNK